MCNYNPTPAIIFTSEVHVRLDNGDAAAVIPQPDDLLSPHRLQTFQQRSRVRRQRRQRLVVAIERGMLVIGAVVVLTKG